MISVDSARASLASASLFMLGGVPGTFHHLYFSGTTTPVMAVGACFSALEVVPLVVLGYEAWEHWHLRQRADWMARVKWPLACFVAVAFWDMTYMSPCCRSSERTSPSGELCWNQKVVKGFNVPVNLQNSIMYFFGSIIATASYVHAASTHGGGGH